MDQSANCYRPHWDDYFMALARIIAMRGTCNRLRAGAVLVKKNRIVASGYNGSPPGLPHCDEAGHLLEEGHCIRTVHGEHNAILQAALVSGVSTEGATMYTKYNPCMHCAKYVVAAGIKRVVIGKIYRGIEAVEYLKAAGIQVDRYYENAEWNKIVRELFAEEIETVIAKEGDVKIATEVLPAPPGDIFGYQSESTPNDISSTSVVIGITGTAGAGKDTIADYLRAQEFSYHSLSDIIREQCARGGLPINRDNLITTGNDLREKFGPGVLGKLTREKITTLAKPKALAVSIRNPSEIEELKKLSGFFLLAVDAPINTRYARVKLRGRPEDAVSFDKFILQEQTERAGSNNQQQLDKVMGLADFHLENAGTFEELYKKINEIIFKIAAT